MHLSIGDQVKLIDEDLEGRIIELKDDLVLIETADGFDYWKSKVQLIKVETSRIQFETETHALKMKEADDIQPTQKMGIRLEGKKPLVDLHIHKISEGLEFTSKHEALIFQIEYFKKAIVVVKKKRIRNIVVIHGYGKGRLRAEIQHLLKSAYPEIEFFDASYQRHGQGAIELIIHGLGKL